MQKGIAEAFTPAIPCLLRRLQRADVLDHRLAPAVDVRPLAVADAVLVAGHVDHIALAARRWHRVVRLLVGDDDQAIVAVLLIQLSDCLTELSAVVTLRLVDRVAQSKAATRRHFDQRVGKAEHAYLLANLTQQYREPVCRVRALHLGPLRERSRHRAGNVDENNRLSRQLLLRADALEHRLLKRLFPLRSVTRRSQKAERQHTRRAHGAERGEYEILVHSNLPHVAQVPEQSEFSEFLLTEQPLPSLALVSARRERDLPRVGHSKFARDQPLPHFGLRLVARLGVGEKQHIAQLDGSAAIVLRQSVLIELGESSRQPLLHLSRERHTPILPVDGDKLSKFVGTLDDLRERLGNEAAMSGMTRHLPHEQQRSMAQLHLCASLDGERGHFFGPNLGDEPRDAARDLDSVLIELALDRK